MKYTAKRTRHKRLEAYQIVSDTGLKAIVEKYADKQWRQVISISPSSILFVHKHFDTMDEVAAYALQKAQEKEEWMKTNLIVV